MLHTLYGEARSPLKGEVTQRGPAILVNLFYKKPPALQRHLFAVQVTVRSSRFRILPRGQRLFLFCGGGFRCREIPDHAEPLLLQQVVDSRALIGKAVWLHRAFQIAPCRLFRFLRRCVFQLLVHAVFQVVVDHHLIPVLRFVPVRRGMGGRFLPCLDLLGQRAVRVKLVLRLLQCGKAPGRGRHPTGNEAVLIAEGPVRFLKDHKMLVAGPIFRGLPVCEVLGGDGAFFCLGTMDIKCCFGLLKGIKAARRRIHRVILIVIAVLDIILAVGVLPDQDGFALPIILGEGFYMLQLAGVLLRLPPAGKFLTDALIIHINLISNVVPHSVAVLSFDGGKAFIRLWRTGGSLFRIGHDPLNKGGGIPLIRVNDFSIHNASFCEGSADGGGIYLRERIILCLLHFRLLFLCLLFVVLLLREGHHLVKIQVGEKFIQVTEAGALDGCCFRTVHQIGQAEGYQIGADLHGVGAVAGGAERQGDMREGGEIGLLLKDFHAVGVDEPFCPLQLRLRHVNDLKALGRRVQLGKEVLGDGLALAVPVEDDLHGRADMVFFLDCRHKFLCAGVLHALAHAAVRAQEVNPAHGQRGVQRFPGVRFSDVSHGCRILRHLKQFVVQRVLRQQAVKFLTGQFLIENRKGRVIEPGGLLVIGQQLILLRPQVHRVAQSKAVFLFRRVQLVIAGVQQRGKGAVQCGKHSLTASRQLRSCLHDGPQGILHHGEDEVALSGAGIHFFVTIQKRGSTGHQIPAVRGFVRNFALRHKRFIITDNAVKIIVDFTAGLSNCRLLPVSGVLLLFRPVQVASSGD